MFLEYRKVLRVIYNNLGALVSRCNVTEMRAVIYCDLGSESLYLCSVFALMLSEMTHQDFSKILIELVDYYRASYASTVLGVVILSAPRAGSGAVSKWVICACDSLVDFGTV